MNGNEESTTNVTGKSTEEYTILAQENDKLFKEFSALKEKYDDLLHNKNKIDEQLNFYKNKYDDIAQTMDDIDILKSKVSKLEMEKTVLMEQLNELKNNDKSQAISVTNDNDRSENTETLMMESLAKLTREKNELEAILEQQKTKQKEYENTISNLQKQLKDNEADREILSNNLDKQQKLYLSLKENAKKQQLEIENTIGHRVELLQTMDEQKAYIQQLQAENQRLMVEKERDDNMMFMELQQLKNSTLAKSVCTQSGQHRMTMMRTQLNIFNDIDFENDTWNQQWENKYNDNQYDDDRYDNDEDINDDERNTLLNVEHAAYPSKSGHSMEFHVGSDMDDEYGTDNDYDKIDENVQGKIDDEKKEEKVEDKQDKSNIEIDFFLLTCIAVKGNLVEEYPNKQEVMNEDAMKLFIISQTEHVEMRKFNLWIEMQLRHKYNLPKLKGFKKFMKKYSFKEKTKEKLKELRKFAKYGHDHELPEMIRKYKKHKGNDDKKTDEYLQKIKNWNNDLLNEFILKNDEYLKDLQYTDSVEIEFFNDIFMKICKFLCYIRFIGATFNEFEKEIEEMCGDIKYNKITLNDIKENDAWNKIYESNLDFIIAEVDNNKYKLFEINGLQSFCNKSIEFMMACYKGNYTKFSGNLSHYIYEYIDEQEIVDDDINRIDIIDDIIAAFMKILNDKKSFCKMLYKSIEKNAKYNNNTDKYQLMDVAEIGVYEQILAAIIINTYCLKEQEVNNDISKEIDEKRDIVLQKCDELNIDEKSQTIIKYFFAYHFKGEENFDGVCSLSPIDCLIQ